MKKCDFAPDVVTTINLGECDYSKMYYSKNYFKTNTKRNNDRNYYACARHIKIQQANPFSGIKWQPYNE